MSTASNHMARSHRSSMRTKSAFNTMSTHAHYRTSEDYTGENLVLKLALFKVLLARHRGAAKKDA